MAAASEFKFAAYDPLTKDECQAWADTFRRKLLDADVQRALLAVNDSMIAGSSSLALSM